MKISTATQKLAYGLTAIVFAAGLAASSPSQADEYPERVNLMKDMGKNLGPIGKAVKGEMAADYPAMAKMAAAIRDDSLKLKDMFPAGTDVGDTRALPVIWEKKADFDAYFDKLASAADALAKEAATGSVADLKASFAAVASNCGGCHKV